MPGWPKWLGEVDHQISGLAYRDGKLYAVPDQSGVETRVIYEVELPSSLGMENPSVSSRSAGDWRPEPGLRTPFSATKERDSSLRVDEATLPLGAPGAAPELVPPKSTSGENYAASRESEMTATRGPRRTEPGRIPRLDRSGERSATGRADLASASLRLRAVCRWQGGPHPDAEGLALAPATGPPRTALIPLESRADALIEVGLDDCAVQAVRAPLAGSRGNEGIEGIALSPDGQTVFFVHESRRYLMKMPRSGPGPAAHIATVSKAKSLCDLAYDDGGTPSVGDDRLLLLDRNRRQILYTTLEGDLLGRWIFDRRALATDPDGDRYKLVALEALAIESRAPDGSLLVLAATDPPPRPLPYRRVGGKDHSGHFQRRVGMLYRFRLPSFEQ